MKSVERRLGEGGGIAYLEGLFQLVCSDVATAVLVKELEGLEHIFLLLQLAQVDSGRQELPVVDAAHPQGIRLGCTAYTALNMPLAPLPPPPMQSYTALVMPLAPLPPPLQYTQDTSAYLEPEGKGGGRTPGPHKRGDDVAGGGGHKVQLFTRNP